MRRDKIKENRRDGRQRETDDEGRRGTVRGRGKESRREQRKQMEGRRLKTK